MSKPVFLWLMPILLGTGMANAQTYVNTKYVFAQEIREMIFSVDS